MLVSFLAGYFNYVFILLLLIIIHELGHLILASSLKFKIDKVIIYPFGGLTKYNEPLNTSILKEFIVLLGGIIFQIIFYLLIIFLYSKGFISELNYKIISEIHVYLIYFNFLPIIPLDGSKLLSLILETFFPYEKSNILLIIISFTNIFLLAIFEKKLFIIILSVILIKTIIEEISIHKIKFNKFLLERYLYNFNFKKGRTINKIKKIKRNRVHNIIDKNKIYTEQEYLNKYYKKNIF